MPLHDYAHVGLGTSYIAVAAEGVRGEPVEPEHGGDRHPAHGRRFYPLQVNQENQHDVNA